MFDFRCEYCAKLRSDDSISVLTVTCEIGFGATMSRNVNYCNADPQCKEGAKGILNEFTKRSKEQGYVFKKIKS